ncbi:capsule assembly Wzi family protein [Cyclobacterium jeungdonense]|uniref:Capsule assembly Wzi family protein n=1 Tax=Cyclobacterium jeungdonense TaxID=708087 RepID=A0ABT8C7T5_9BACT|nr:capsule assembly Wzi family protein [Cyclobacterium jeungdonense]MDN3688853.1 capsule assembly Wzi family protein [Cyclobacterium jeungdonense]
MKLVWNVFLFMLFGIHQVSGQFLDSLKIETGLSMVVASKDYPPFWIQANQFGTVGSERQLDLIPHLSVENSHYFRLGKSKIETTEANFHLGYGLDVYANNGFNSVFAKEAFVRLGYQQWELRAGRFAELIGELDPELSSGSFAVSGNALPIPKLTFIVNRFTDVPGTRGFLQFKGQYSHGWLGNSHSVKNAFLHEKVLYLKAGRKPFSFYAGLMHFAQWGGEHQRGPMPGRFKDYLRIIVGASGDPDDPVYQQGAGSVDVANAVGNHMINSDIGLEVRLAKSRLKLYTQTIFSKGRGDSSNLSRRDDLVAFNMFGKDRMVGLSWTTDRKSWVEKVLLEGIYTKEQGGDIIFNGRFNYYNNATYATGWVYQENIIGTPLFISQNQAANYELDPNGIGGLSVVSNRIVGYHGGIMGSLGKHMRYRTLITFVSHFGNYYNDAYFTPNKKQSYFLLELSHRLNPKISVVTAIALDRGELSNNVGAQLAVEWTVK